MDVLPETATINAIMYDEKPRLSILYRDGKEEQCLPVAIPLIRLNTAILRNFRR